MVKKEEGALSVSPQRDCGVPMGCHVTRGPSEGPSGIAILVLLLDQGRGWALREPVTCFMLPEPGSAWNSHRLPTWSKVCFTLKCYCISKTLWNRAGEQRTCTSSRHPVWRLFLPIGSDGLPIGNSDPHCMIYHTSNYLSAVRKDVPYKEDGRGTNGNQHSTQHWTGIP